VAEIFQNAKKSPAELCQIIRIVTVYTVINSTLVRQHMCVTMLPVLHCLWGDAFVSSCVMFSSVFYYFSSCVAITE